MPKALWGRSLAALARKQSKFGPKWQGIRQKEFSRTNGRCESCGGQARSLHEIWDYDDARHVQRLVGFEPVCELCSLTQHMGRAHEIGRGAEAEQQIARVNGISLEQVGTMLQTAAIVWMARNEHSWTQDLSWLRDRAGEYGMSREDVDEAEKLFPQMGWKKP